MTDFGAFVKLEEGIEGLIYSSELAAGARREARPTWSGGGRTVTALVTKVDPVEQKISLSIRALTDKEQREALKKLAAQQARARRRPSATCSRRSSPRSSRRRRKE